MYIEYWICGELKSLLIFNIYFKMFYGLPKIDYRLTIMVNFL